jgi:uncharacterized membrane protein (UPF0136 family)
MSLAIIAAIAYGILVLVGGIIGYTKAKSKPSLIAGLVSGLLLLGSAFLAMVNTSLGLILAKIITTILIVIFALRLWKTRKFMPAGLMLIAGIIALGMMLLNQKSDF